MRAFLSELRLGELGEEIWDELAPRAEGALGRGVARVLDKAKENLSRRQGTRRSAAPAGEPPELDLGRLRDSLKPGRVRRTKYSVRQEYGSDHPAAGLHEFGGTTGGIDGRRRIYPPRPYIRPAEEETRAEVDEILEAL